MTIPLLDIQGLTFEVDRHSILDRLDLAVQAGEIHALLCSNGSGKTTTIRMLLNILTPDQGEILINGRPFDEELKNRIGYLPEERGLYRKMKVRDLLCYMGELKGLTSAQANKQLSLIHI